MHYIPFLSFHISKYVNIEVENIFTWLLRRLFNFFANIYIYLFMMEIIEVNHRKRSKMSKHIRKELKKSKKLREAGFVVGEDGEIIQEEEKNKKLNKTISIAVPGSILENAQSEELSFYLVGQIARAATIFKIDEIVIFNDSENTTDELSTNKQEDNFPSCCVKFARNLQYVECPQYLRKKIFPLHRDLQLCCIINSLDAPHHLRQTDNFPYREGVVTDTLNDHPNSSFVDVGLKKEVLVDKLLTPGIRVTVKIEQNNGKKLKGTIVSPTSPKLECGVYWGYNVRLANCLSAVFSQCPYSKGYDLSIGTSEHGSNIDEVPIGGLKEFHHAIIVFGGLKGLEFALKNDPVLHGEDPFVLFDKYYNTCPEQGSRIIRTEEAILITLSELRTKLCF